MRLTGPLACAALLGATGCASGGGPVSPLQCRIALAYIKDFKADAAKPIGVWSSPAGWGGSLQDIDSWVKEHPQYAQTPEVARIRAQNRVQDISVVGSCAEVRAWLDGARIPHDDARIRQLTAKEPWPIATLGMSLPVFTDGGATASFIVEEYWGGLGGSVSAIVYKRGADGRWRLVERDMLAIS